MGNPYPLTGESCELCDRPLRRTYDVVAYDNWLERHVYCEPCWHGPRPAPEGSEG